MFVNTVVYTVMCPTVVGITQYILRPSPHALWSGAHKFTQLWSHLLDFATTDYCHPDYILSQSTLSCRIRWISIVHLQSSICFPPPYWCKILSRNPSGRSPSHMRALCIRLKWGTACYTTRKFHCGLSTSCVQVFLEVFYVKPHELLENVIIALGWRCIGNGSLLIKKISRMHFSVKEVQGIRSAAWFPTKPNHADAEDLLCQQVKGWDLVQKLLLWLKFNGKGWTYATCTCHVWKKK